MNDLAGIFQILCEGVIMQVPLQVSRECFIGRFRKEYHFEMIFLYHFWKDEK